MFSNSPTENHVACYSKSVSVTTGDFLKLLIQRITALAQDGMHECLCINF